MKYNLIFYAVCIIYLYHSITGNEEMIEQSFRGLVILGFVNLFSMLQTLKGK